MIQQTHEQLLQQLNSGNIHVLCEIYNEFKQQLFSFCCRVLRDEDKAEDAVHETMVKLLLHSNSISNAKSLKSWLFTVARNECYSILKYQQRKEELTEESLWDEESLQKDIERNEQKEIVKNAIESLKIEYREVVVLREYEQLSYEEIAAITETPISTVKSRLFKARKFLAKKLNMLKGNNYELQ